MTTKPNDDLFDGLRPRACPECGKETTIIPSPYKRSMPRVHTVTRLKACTPERPKNDH